MNLRTAHQYRKRLSIRQEEFLVDWILEQDAQGFPLPPPPTYARTRKMATRIFLINGINQELRNKFASKFIRDNPRTRSVFGRSTEAARINGTNPEAIQELYTLCEDIVSRFHIQPCSTWNTDEHGIAVGVCTNTKVLASSEKSHSYFK